MKTAIEYATEYWVDADPRLVDLFADAISAARAAEREECAKVAEDEETGDWKAIAAAIRARRSEP